MESFINVNTTPGANDTETIQNAIARAREQGLQAVLIPKRNDRTDEDKWVISETVYLPSNIEIILDNAYLVMADGVYANMFANESVLNPAPRTAADEQKNITIRGIGNAVLSGGNYNGLSEDTSLQEGRPHISKNTMLLMVNVANLCIEGIKIEKQRWWAITNVFVRDSVFRNIAFDADLSRIDDRGVHHPDELPRSYSEVYIKNADGIDLRIGCNNIRIENITGFTEDDSVALTALGKWEAELGYTVSDKDADIHDVVIENIAVDSYICSNVRLLCENGYKIYNVRIDGVKDIRRRPEYKSQYNIRLGDSADAYATLCHSKMGDLYNIQIRNQYANGAYAVSMCKHLKDSSVDNILGGPDCRVGFGFCHTHLRESRIENVSFGNILCTNPAARPLFLENNRAEEQRLNQLEV